MTHITADDLEIDVTEMGVAGAAFANGVIAQQAARIAELERQLAQEREAKMHETKRAQTLMQERNKWKAFESSTAKILEHTRKERDAARQSRKRLVEFVRYRARELENADEFIRDIEAERDAAREETEQAQGHAVAYLHRANEAEQDARALAYRIDDMGDFWDWETKEKDLEIARKYIKDGEQ